MVIMEKQIDDGGVKDSVEDGEKVNFQ